MSQRPTSAAVEYFSSPRRLRRFLLIVLLIVLAVIAIAVWEMRNTPFGSRTGLFGGRALDPGATGSVAFASRLDDVGTSTLLAVPAQGGEPRSLLKASKTVPSVTWNPAGTRFAYLRSGPQDSRELAVASPGSKALPADPGTVWYAGNGDGEISWSPDGRRIAYIDIKVASARTAQVVVSGPDGRVEQRLPIPTSGHDSHPSHLAWLADGGVVCAVRGQSPDGKSFTRAYVLRAGAKPRRLAGVEAGEDTLAVSPDGRHLLATGAERGISRVFAVGGGKAGSAVTLPENVTAASFSADSRRLLLVRDGYLMTADPDGTRIHRVGHMPQRVSGSHRRRGRSQRSVDNQNTTSAAWSPDGRHIAAVRSGKSGDTVVVMNRDGTGQTPIYSAAAVGAVIWRSA